MMDGRSEFFSQYRVSRETEERLDLYVALLMKWTKKINLVSPGTFGAVWTRHFQDSAQVLDLAPENASSWADLGSGGGFPGAVVAILAQDFRPGIEVTLVEADQRKSTFLRTVSRETGVPFKVLTGRIEEVPPLQASVVSARALAPLTDLLGLVDRHISPVGKALLMKGASWETERASALEHWTFDCDTHLSKTDADAVILEIGEIKRV